MLFAVYCSGQRQATDRQQALQHPLASLLLRGRGCSGGSCWNALNSWICLAAEDAGRVHAGSAGQACSLQRVSQYLCKTFGGASRAWLKGMVSIQASTVLLSIARAVLLAG